MVDLRLAALIVGTLGLLASCTPVANVASSQAPEHSVAARLRSAPDRAGLLAAQRFRIELEVIPGWTGNVEALQIFEDGSYVFEQGDETTTGVVPPASLGEIRAGANAFHDMDRVSDACPRVMDATRHRVVVRIEGRTRSYEHSGCLRRGLGCAAMLFEYLVATRSGVAWQAGFFVPPPALCEPDAPSPRFPGDRGRPTFLDE